ncbi:MAG: EAL domain-containing protein [Epsilonproteobacteria bacterium]|nr:EAL domain-containing protein [Campylobacterota bacterium]
MQLYVRLIAEGVETQEQLDFLLENGCENIQGYYFSEPVDTQTME